MNYMDKIISTMEKQGGLITTAQVSDAHIPRCYLSEMIKRGLIERAGRGIYILPEVWEDEMFLLQFRYSKGIYSHETALYLHGFTDRTPLKFVMTFPYGYHAESIHNTNVSMRKSISKLYEMGITECDSPCGNSIKLYDIERTLCDVVKGNNICDIHIVNQAMKQYAGFKKKNISRLVKYAELLRVKTKIIKYMEILL